MIHDEAGYTLRLKADFTSEAFLNHKEVIKRTKFPAFDDKLNKITRKAHAMIGLYYPKLRKHIDNNVS